MAAPTPSLSQFLNGVHTPTLLLDFRIPPTLEHPSKATISDTIVSRNEACDYTKFKESVEAVLTQRLSNGRSNPRLQARDPVIGPETVKHVIGKDVWKCSSLGPYAVWTLQEEQAPKDGDLTESLVQDDDTSGNANEEVIEEPSREQQLFNKLDHLHGPLKEFCNLADQTLTEVQATIKSLSNPQDTTLLHPIELNLRTLTSGLSLLKDLSDISSFTPKSPDPPPQKEPLSSQALLSKILSRVHPPPPLETGYNAIKSYVMTEKLEAHIPTLRAVIIEDNLVNSKILTKFTQKLGVLPEYITPAFNGQEGLEVIENMAMRGCFPDLIFVDWAMPVMDGLEFLQKFHERWPRSKARIVGMLVWNFSGDNRMQKLGANTVLTKPIKWNIIRYEIERAATLKMTREIEFRGRL
ncbi:hypothetical protein TWF481_009194 [Arthrobotrys musiformis]|uniref:Response regulatory domain-containing protein n=1 Tax=Arthrobotrys musiformis TaxID=47236 RepID=A0AAV9W2V5_9PEZI